MPAARVRAARARLAALTDLRRRSLDAGQAAREVIEMRRIPGRIAEAA